MAANASSWNPKPNMKKILLDILTYAALVIIIFCVDLPFISMFGTALKGRSEALSSPALFPAEWKFDSFGQVLTGTTFGNNIFNSAVVAVTVTVCCIMFAVCAGYAISRFRGVVFNFYSVFVLLLQMFPGTLMMIPLFVIFKNLNMVDTLYSVMFAYTTLNLPFSIWMTKGFFDTIPIDIEEAAQIDGCNQFSGFLRVVLPISMPGISTVGIFTFINAWGEYTLASIFLRSDSIGTLTIGLQKFVLQYTSDWPALMAASCIATIPTLIFLLVAQKYLIQGMSAGAVKG